MVTKDALLTEVWPDRVIEENNLQTQISALRRVLARETGGEHYLITIPGRGYRFVAPVEFVGRVEDAGGGTTNLPSIAVLAFTNMSGDPVQDYLSNGIAEDIITELSRFAELLVIARNSSFQFKGRSVDVRQVGRELGVRYVLEGSIRQAGDHIRISAQLIDAVTGAHRWAERYDRKLNDVFAVQDNVVRTIAALLAVHLNKAETERVLATSPATWQAHEHYLRAAETLVLYHSSLNKEDLLQGRHGLFKALAIDPNYARAHAALAMTYMSLWSHRWDDDCPWSAAHDRAYQSAREAVRLAPNLPAAHVAIGWALVFFGRHEAAVAAFERAIVLNPNLTNFRFAHTLLLAGRPARAVQLLKAHMRLDPFYQPQAPLYLGIAYYLLKRYAEGLRHLQECVSRAPDLAHSRYWLAATYGQLGEYEKAKAEMAEGLRIEPWFTISQSISANACKRPEDGKHLKDGLRKAGCPE